MRPKTERVSPSVKQLQPEPVLPWLWRWLASLLIIATLLIAACSDRPIVPDLASWLGGEKSPGKFVKLDDGLYAAISANADGKVDRVCLTKGRDVILSVELYGNGQAISIASGGSPTLLVHQGASGLDVTRYVRLPQGSFTQLVYGPDGKVVEEREVRSNQDRPSK
jgi:hypothetical protein